MPRPRYPKPRIKVFAAKNKREIAESENLTAHRQPDPDKAVFPLHYAIFVVNIATSAGCFSARQIALYWKGIKPVVKSIYSDIPDSDIAPDTIHETVSFIGRMETVDFIYFYGASMAMDFPDLFSDDTGKILPPSKEKTHLSYVVNCLDTADGFTLRQLSLKAKNDTSPLSTDFIELLDLRGGIITADILDTEKYLTKLFTARGSDYCLALKGSGEPFAAGITALFDNVSRTKERAMSFGYPLWFCARDEILDPEPLATATRNIRVFPALLLLKTKHEDREDFITEWAGLIDGCVAVVTEEITDRKANKTTVKVRYFISSLKFDEEYSAARISRLISEHWQNQDKLHWELDLTFNHDRSRCSNADYIKGREALNNYLNYAAKNHRDNEQQE